MPPHNNGIVLGSYIIDSYGRRGRVIAIHSGCPEDQSWLQSQDTPMPGDGRWVSALVEGGGSIHSHDGFVALTQPFDLENDWESFYFESAG